MSVSSCWGSFIFTLEIVLLSLQLYLLSFQSTLHSLLVFLVLCYHYFFASTVVSSSDIPWDPPNDLSHLTYPPLYFPQQADDLPIFINSSDLLLKKDSNSYLTTCGTCTLDLSICTTNSAYSKIISLTTVKSAEKSK